MSWNPVPTIGGASWAGNPQLITKNQLLSTSYGFYEDLKDFNFSTLSVSTLNVPLWISTPVLYVSDIQGASIDISGIIFDASGLLYAPLVSSQTGIFQNITNISIMQLSFKPTFTGNIQVSFDLGLGQAIGGLLAGLGAAVGGALIGVGTGVGLTIQGAETGIATIIAGRPQNFITNNTYETVNFTSQLQVSTLGNAYPLYSSIFRTVSSVSANSVPGREIFTSSFFSPGQICVRTVSDPFNLITGDSNLNTSTIQSFGQWVALEGLEPENIIANSILTNTLSSGTANIDYYEGNAIFVNGILASNGIQIGQNNFPGQLSIPYESVIEFQTGATGGYSKQLGSLNYWWFQSDSDIIFSRYGDTGTTPFNAQLSLGSNANESFLQVSSIFSRGNIQANTGFYSTLQVEQLIVISSLSTIFTESNVLFISTAIVEANEIFARLGVFSTIETSSISQFSFTSPLGNPNGSFDITKLDTVVSTTYDQISSLTQNILSYSLNTSVNDQTVWNLPLRYNCLPSNVEMWASTIAYRGATGGNAVALGLSYYSNWTQGPITSGTFDLIIDQTQGIFSMNVSESSNYQNTQVSTILSIPPTPGFSNSYRFILQSNGWWDYTSPAPPPYITSNNNTFKMYQDINDTWIEGTDRLHVKAGNIFLDGVANFGDVGLFQATDIFSSNVTTCNMYASNGYFTTVVSTVKVNEPYSFTGSLNDAPTENPLNINYIINSTDFKNLRTLVNASRGWNGFTYQNLNEWNDCIFNTIGVVNTSDLPLVIVGETFSNNPNFTPYKGGFWINNTTSAPIASFFPVQSIKPGGQGVLSTIGNASRNGSGYTRVFTSDGQNWSTTSNVANPQGDGSLITNAYNLQVGPSNTILTASQPLIENIVSKQIYAEKITNYVPQIRVYTNASPSFQSREAGMEQTSYFDSNVIFTGSQSDAVNLIINPLGNLYYAFSAWTPMCWFSRIRTNSFGIQGFDIAGIPVLVSGTPGDFCWASARYLNVNDTSPVADIRENYLMIPNNYMTYTTFPLP